MTDITILVNLKRAQIARLICGVALSLAFLSCCLPAYGQRRRSSKARSRFIKVTVTDAGGNAVNNAQVTIVDALSLKPLPGQIYAVGQDGTKRLVVRSYPGVKMVVSAPGYATTVQAVYFSNQYTVKLRPPGKFIPPMDFPRTSSRLPAVVKQKRAIRVVVEGPSGKRLRDAEVAIIEARTKRILERKYLIEGLGNLEFEAKPGIDLELVASAPGSLSQRQEMTAESSYLFRLRARVVTPPPPPLRKLHLEVKDAAGRGIKDAEVSVVDLGSNKVIERLILPAGSGSVQVEVPKLRDAELIARAAGFVPARRRVNTDTDFSFQLKAIVVTPPPRKTRKISILVEAKEGGRLRGAQVSLVDGKTGKAITSQALPAGLGSMAIAIDIAAGAKIVATAPGHLPAALPVDSSTNYLLSLERKLNKARMRVLVKDLFDRRVAQATLMALEEGKERARATTDAQGLADLSFTYSDASKLVLEVHHGGYRTRKSPLRTGAAQPLEMVLQPARPALKSSLVAVLVLSKAFTASPKTFAAVRKAMGAILEDNLKHKELWASIGALSVADGRVRDILPLTKNIREESIHRAKSRLSGLYGQGGTLSWRDLQAITRFINNSTATGEAGCDVVVIAPKNLSMDPSLALYDAGGDTVMESFRSHNLRLRLIEVGFAGDSTRAYQELCEGTQGFYASLAKSSNLTEAIVDLQFHYPNPPPSAR